MRICLAPGPETNPAAASNPSEPATICARRHKAFGLCHAHYLQYIDRGRDKAKLTYLGAPRRTKGCAHETGCDARHYRNGLCYTHYRPNRPNSDITSAQLAAFKSTKRVIQPTKKKSALTLDISSIDYSRSTDDQLRRAMSYLARSDALDCAEALGLTQ